MAALCCRDVYRRPSVPVRSIRIKSFLFTVFHFLRCPNEADVHGECKRSDPGCECKRRRHWIVVIWLNAPANAAGHEMIAFRVYKKSGQKKWNEKFHQIQL